MQKGKNSNSFDFWVSHAEMCLLRGVSETWARFQSVFADSEVCFSPYVGSAPGNGLFWGSDLWKGKSLESISHCTPKSRHSPVLTCPAFQPKWCIGTQSLTSIEIKVSFFLKKYVKGTSPVTLQLPRHLKFIMTYIVYFIIRWSISTLSTIIYGTRVGECWKI